MNQLECDGVIKRVRLLVDASVCECVFLVVSRMNMLMMLYCLKIVSRRGWARG